MALEISSSEQARIDRLGLVVNEAGAGTIVVRHPQHKRRKHEGGNLSALITAWEMDLEELNKKKPVDKPKPNSSSGKAKLNNVVDIEKAQATLAQAKPVPARKRPEPAASAAPKPAVRGKPKREPADWKTYAIGKLILLNTSKDADAIFDMCKANKIDTKLATVKGLTRYIRLTMQIQKDLAKEKR